MTLAARDLEFGYPSKRVGADLSVTLERGEILCVLGPNGSGKSTLFRTLLGLQPALGGDIDLDGRPLASWHRRELARRVAYVPQASTSYFDFSVREFVEMGRTAHLGPFARPGPRDRDIADDSIATLRIAPLAERSIHALSGGERQLALIARALATQAGYFVMDEPTANLDFGNQALILEELGRLREAGIGVLVSTHHPDHAFRVADRALLLHKGSALALGRADEVLTPEHLSRLYGVPIRVAVVEGPDGRRSVCVP